MYAVSKKSYALLFAIVGMVSLAAATTTTTIYPAKVEAVAKMAETIGCTFKDGVLQIRYVTQLCPPLKDALHEVVLPCALVAGGIYGIMKRDEWAAQVVQKVNDGDTGLAYNHVFNKPESYQVCGAIALAIAAACVLNTLNNRVLKSMDKRPLFQLDQQGITYFERTALVHGPQSSITKKSVLWNDVRQVIRNEEHVKRTLNYRSGNQLIEETYYESIHPLLLKSRDGTVLMRIEESEDLPLSTHNFAEIILYYANTYGQ